MAANKALEAVVQLRQYVESLGPPIYYRKLNGILNALEMQVEDGRYDRHAVTRLCEALLASAAAHEMPEGSTPRLEQLAAAVVHTVER